MAKFQRGHKFAKGGLRNPPGGRPTKAQAEEKKLAAEKAREIIEGNAERLTNRYVKRALSPNADKILMHAVDKLVPAAKQELKISGGLKIVKVDAFQPDDS
jgi:hypothetical protein